ncbi:MAG: hypothetical protein HY658_15090, partial [Actinobacteria bacterium]|nr:hypothetical protein [Actinomycetota bacterium]
MASGRVARRLRRRFAAGVLLTTAGVVMLVSGAGAQAAAIRDGDVMVSLAGGVVEWHAPDGELISTFQTGGGQLTGMTFSPEGSLYVTDFERSVIHVLDELGNPAGTFGPTFDAQPESIVFDAEGSAYVGQAEGTQDILKLDPQGQIVARYDAQTEDRGTDWIDLAADQCTIFYTSELASVLRYDACGDQQLPAFATGLPGERAYAVRVLPDGGALVADTDFIVRLSPSGEEVRRYDAPGMDDWFALNLDPDGTSFWSAGLTSDEVFKFDLATGDVVLSFTVATPGASIGGVTVKGEITAARSGGSQFASSLAGPDDLTFTVAQVLTNVAIAGGIVLLMPFPAELFNSTLEANYDEIMGWFRGIRRRASSVVARGDAAERRSRPAWVPYLVVTLVVALLYALLDTTIGFDLASLEVYLGIVAGLVVVTAIFEGSIGIYLRMRKRSPGRLRPYPGSVPIAAACVLISRLIRFSPGYLYGLVAARETEDMPAEEEGRTTAVWGTFVLVVTVAAWFVREPIHDSVIAGAGFGMLLLDTALVVTFVAGLESLIFGLLPLRFLDGSALFRWNRVFWSVLFGIGVLGFVYVLLNPQSGNLAQAAGIGTFVLFGVFGAVSVLFWAFFRFREDRARAAVAAAGSPPPTSSGT